MNQTPEERRERDRLYKRQYRQANPEKRREYERRRYQTPERQDWMRHYREANRDRINEASRRRYKANPEGVLAQNARWRHGKDITEDFAAMWQVQGGCCYLCKKPLTRGKAVVDHDHAHCGAEKSCSYCRRGLACTLCNVLIGDANDDPQLLRTIADNLESALNATRDRIAAAPRQEMLDLMEA